jgi:hypothetical protein
MQRQRAGGVDLLLRLLGAGGVVVLVEKRVARRRQDQLRDLLAMTGEASSARKSSARIRA